LTSRTMLVACIALGSFVLPPLSLGQSDRCSSECFNQRNIRDWQILDDSTVILFAGRERCPFIADIDSVTCDVRFLPAFLEIRKIELGSRRVTRNLSGRVCTYDPRLEFVLEVQDFVNDDPTGQGCRIFDLRQVSDDSLVELYVDRDMLPPPPPVGSGEVTKVEDEEPADDSSDEEE
jgi:hypothetical protein